MTTIASVAAELGEDEDWLAEVANEMEPEDGLIWVYGPDDEGVMAFSDFGIESLKDLIAIHKQNPSIIQGYREAIDKMMKRSSSSTEG